MIEKNDPAKSQKEISSAFPPPHLGRWKDAKDKFCLLEKFVSVPAPNSLGRKQNALDSFHLLYLIPVAAVINCQKLDGLEWQVFILSQLWRPEIPKSKF